MMGGRSSGSELDQGIRQARRLSLDGTRAVYDLTQGIDFSRPRATAEAIARVLWDEDVQDWWSVKDGTAVFAPSRSVELRIPDEHNRRVAKTVEDFKRDLKGRELADHLRDYLDSASDYSVDWATVFLMGPLWAYLIESSEIRARRREEVERLFSQMSDYIQVSPQ